MCGCSSRRESLRTIALEHRVVDISDAENSSRGETRKVSTREEAENTEVEIANNNWTEERWQPEK